MSCSYRFNPPVSILVICLRLPKIQPLKSDHYVPHKRISGKDHQIKRKKTALYKALKRNRKAKQTILCRCHLRGHCFETCFPQKTVMGNKMHFPLFFCFFCYLFKKKSDRSICLFLLRKAFFFSFKTMIRKNTARNARPFSKEREQFCFGRFAQLDIWKELVTAFCKSLFKSFCFCHHPECPSLSVTLSLKPMTFPPIPPFAGSP